MKLKTVITELTLEDLSTFFSTALTGSFWAGVDYPAELIEHKSEIKEKDDYLETVISKWLMKDPNNYIIIYDIESDYDEENNSVLGEDYWKLTLKDLVKGWEKAYINNNGKLPPLDEMDLCDADEVLQTALFGEVVFG